MASLATLEPGYHSHITDFDVVPFGETFIDQDSDPAMKDDLTVYIEAASSSQQLVDIMVMRSEIAQSPQPGDEQILELLAFDEIILRSGADEEYVSRVLELYPDIPEVITETAGDSIAVVATIDDDIDPEVTFAAFKEQPLEFLSHLSNDEAHRVLQTLTAMATDQQVDEVIRQRQAHVALAA